MAEGMKEGLLVLVFGKWLLLGGNPKGGGRGAQSPCDYKLGPLAAPLNVTVQLAPAEPPSSPGSRSSRLSPGHRPVLWQVPEGGDRVLMKNIVRFNFPFFWDCFHLGCNVNQQYSDTTNHGVGIRWIFVQTMFCIQCPIKSLSFKISTSVCIN